MHIELAGVFLSYVVVRVANEEHIYPKARPIKNNTYKYPKD